LNRRHHAPRVAASAGSKSSLRASPQNKHFGSERSCETEWITGLRQPFARLSVLASNSFGIRALLKY
jgi:hypothetical protein